MATANVQALSLPEFSADMAYDVDEYRGSLFGDSSTAEGRIGYLRRLKVGADMDITDRVGVSASFDYDRDDVKFDIDDAYLEVKLSDPLKLYVGRFKEPFTLSEQISQKTQYLLERPVPVKLLGFGRNQGVSLRYNPDHWLAQAAIMKVPSEDEDFDDAYAYVGRVTVAPIQSKSSFLHFGAGASLRDATDGKYQVKGKVIAHGFGNLIKSAKYDAESIFASNLEFAAQYFPLLIQAEHLLQDVHTEDNQTHRLQGSYVTLLWTLLGKPRKYDDDEVDFDGKAEHTVELAYGYSLTDVTAGIKGDKAAVHDVALNYYASSRFKLAVQYSYARLGDWDDDGSIAVETGKALSFRIQFIWD